MENKTALQQAFSDLEQMQPHLFNVFSQEGRDFVYHFHKYLEIEKQQIIDAVEWNYKSNMGEVYYKAKFENEPI
jgi:hypothetical protein